MTRTGLGVGCAVKGPETLFITLITRGDEREHVDSLEGEGGSNVEVTPTKDRWSARQIGDFADHATFRENGANTDLVGQTWWLSFFDPM